MILPAHAANTYYIDSVSGNNSADGLSESKAWQSLNRIDVNTTAFGPGDQILLKRGSTWIGESIIIPVSGTPSAPLIIDAYGAGKPPIISGFTDSTLLPLSWQFAPLLSSQYSPNTKIWSLTSSDLSVKPEDFVNWIAVLEYQENGQPVLRRLRPRIHSCHTDGGQELLNQNYDFTWSSQCPDESTWNFWVRIDEGNPGLNGQKIFLVLNGSGPLLDTNEKSNVIIRNLNVRGTAGSHAMPALLLRNSEGLTIENNEFSYSKMAMSTREPLSILNKKALLGRYRIDTRIGSSNTIVTDLSGSGNHGLVLGASWVEGREGQPALAFDGIDDYVDFDVNNESAFDIQDALTIMGWFNHSSTGGDGFVGIQKHLSYHLVAVETDQASSRYQFRIIDPAGNIHNIYTPFLTNDSWHHLAGLYDGNELRIYVDGVSASNPVLWNGGVANSANTLEFGRRSTFRYFKGAIDDVSIFSRALSDNEIYQMAKSPNYLRDSSIRNNSIHNNLEGGIELAGLSSNNTIIANDIFNNWNLGEIIGDRVGIELTQYESYYAPWRKTGNIIESNRVHANGDINVPQDDSVIAIYGGTDTQVRYNDIFDNQQPAFYFSWSENSVFHYNLVRNNTALNGRHLALIGNNNLKLYNNTIVGNTLYATTPNNPYNSWRLISIDGPTLTGSEIKNNIIANNRMYSDMSAYPTMLMMVWPATASVDNNLYFDNLSLVGTQVQPLWLTNQATYSDFNDWQTNSGYDQGGQEADPAFVNTGTSDFAISSGSPAIDSGFIVGIIDSITGILTPHSRDYRGDTLLNSPDIGAYEFGNNDTDGDGVIDYDEICYDGNCTTYNPYNPVSNQTGTDLNFNIADTDGDGFSDGTEKTLGSNPLNPISVPSIVADGDISLDGTINAADILLAQRHILGLTVLTAEQLAHGDLYPASGSGTLTLSDLILILKLTLQ